MSAIAAQRFFEGQATLPAMPEVAQRLLNTFARETASIGELAALIGNDASLSARLLRLANSPRYAPAARISRLTDAAMVLGLGPLRGLALSASLADAFPHPIGFDRLRFWRQNLATSGYASWLARRLGLDAAVAEVAGLLLRGGQVLMLIKEPGITALVEALAGPPDSVFDLERLHFGCTHADVSAEMAVRWRFPTAMVDALYTASDPLNAQPFSPVGAVLRAASVMADAAGDGLDPLLELQARQPALVQGLGLDLERLTLGLPEHTVLVEPVTDLMG